MSTTQMIDDIEEENSSQKTSPSAEPNAQHFENEALNSLNVSYAVAHEIGKRLKEAREKSFLTQEQVTTKTKIRLRFIEAIETGDWDQLPPNLYGRGLVRILGQTLRVELPEFEKFNALQTVQVEHQSKAMTEHVFKKSKYQPAAQESAEVVYVVDKKGKRKTLPAVSPKANATPISFNPSSFQATEEEEKEKYGKVFFTEFLIRKSSLMHQYFYPFCKILFQKTKKSLIFLTPFISQSKEFFYQFKKTILLGVGSLVVCALVAAAAYLKINSMQNQSIIEPLQQISQEVPQPVVATPAVLAISEPAVVPVTTPPSVVAIPQKAEIDILAPVRVEIKADGKDILTGYQAPGQVNFEFNQTATLIVYDASKVKLKYAGWNHGELGMGERKRKIVLNAKPFTNP